MPTKITVANIEATSPEWGLNKILAKCDEMEFGIWAKKFYSNEPLDFWIMHFNGVDLSQSPWTTFCMQGGCRTHSAKMMGEDTCLQCLPIPMPMEEGIRYLPVPTDPDSPASSELLSS